MSEKKFTPGPWGWFGNAGGSPEIYLAAKHSGRVHVMGFERWGFNGAQPSFRPDAGSIVKAQYLLKFEVGDKSVTGTDEPRKNTSVYRMQIRGIDAPDAHLIAAAPELYEALEEVSNCLSDIVSWAEHDSVVEHLRKAAAALAKARGETP